MYKFGEYLRNVRNDKGMSLNKVYQATGITNSRLSKAEAGCCENLKFFELKKLADLYQIPVISMCLMAGMLTEDDLEQYHSSFKNVSLLDEEDKQHIQSEIDYILKKRG